MGPSLFPELVPEAGADVAYTPEPVASAIVRLLLAGELDGLVAWEPYVGAAAFSIALDAAGCEVWVSDLDPAAPGLRSSWVEGSVVCDVGRGLPEGFPRPDWIVTNPPFSMLDAHLPILLDTAKVGVALLLVGQSVAPGVRDWMWENAMPDVQAWARERIKFQGPGRDGTGSDMREYAVLIFRRQPDGGWMGRGLMARFSVALERTWPAGLFALPAGEVDDAVL